MSGDNFSDDPYAGETIQIPRFGVGQKIFRRYTLQKVLGRGGMGVVWLARDDQLERFVALKVLPETISYDSVSLDALKRETKLGLNLAHPNIVRVYDFQRDDVAAAISMEYVDGPNLSDLRLTKPDQVFAAAELHEHVQAMCDALSYAHTREKIVHRDLKPRNLMLNSRGELKVTDFGISRSISESMTMLTGTLGSSGSPPYISPQQWDGERATPLDDIYSVGATLYELLSSRPPLIGVVDWQQVHHKIPPPISRRRLDLGLEVAEPVPAQWEETIAACLAKDPKDRPQSIRELQARLTQPVNGTLSHPPPVPPPVTDGLAADVDLTFSADALDDRTLDFGGDTIVSRNRFPGPKVEVPPVSPAGSAPPPAEAKPIETEARAQELAAQKAAEEAKKLAEQKAAEEAKRIAEQKAAEEAKWLAAQKAAEEAKRIADQRAAEEARRIAQQKAAEEAKKVAAQKAAEEAKRIADQKAAEEAKRIAAQKAAEEAKKVAAQKAAEEAKRIADQRAAEEAKRIAAQKAAEEAKKVAVQKAAEEAKRIADQKAAEEANRIAAQKAAEEAKKVTAQKAAEEAKRIADQKAAEEAKRIAAQKAAEEAKKLAAQKAAVKNSGATAVEPPTADKKAQDKKAGDERVTSAAPSNLEALEEVSEETLAPAATSVSPPKEKGPTGAIVVEPSPVPRKGRNLRPLQIGIAALLVVSLTYGVIKMFRSPRVTEDTTSTSSPAPQRDEPVVESSKEQKAVDDAKLAEQHKAEEAKRLADKKAADDAKLAEQQKAEEKKRLADKKAADDAKVAEQHKAEEAKRLADKKAADDAKLAEQQKAEEKKKLADKKASDDTKLAEQQKAEEAKRLADKKAADDAKLAEQQAAEEKKRVADKKAADNAKPLAETPRTPKTHANQKQSANRPASVAPSTRPPPTPRPRPPENRERTPKSDFGPPGG